MHNLKDIRSSYDEFEKLLKKRFISIDINNLKSLDEKNRKLIQEKENLEKEKKEISKSKDKSLYEKSKKISSEISEIAKKQSLIKDKIDEILVSLPNLPCDDVPIGKDENENVEILKSGSIKKFNFKPKSHYEIGENLNMLDFDLATKTTGARFVFVKDQLALLERAISNFMLDTHININGYKEVSPPLIATEDTMFGTGQLPKFENDQFELKLEDIADRKFLIPTAEVILTNMVKDQILDKKKLPYRFVASTPCFRKEAGSYGKDTKGLIRQHQFEKVELVQIVHPDNSFEALDNLLANAEEVLQVLELPYQVVELCSCDLGFSATKTYDIEVWMPSQNKYREISSCSNFGDFQARRGKIRVKDGNNKMFAHTINGSALAAGRTLIAIIENNFDGKNTIKVPEILVEFMGKTHINLS